MPQPIKMLYAFIPAGEVVQHNVIHFVYERWIQREPVYQNKWKPIFYERFNIWIIDSCRRNNDTVHTSGAQIINAAFFLFLVAPRVVNQDTITQFRSPLFYSQRQLRIKRVRNIFDDQGDRIASFPDQSFCHITGMVFELLRYLKNSFSCFCTHTRAIIQSHRDSRWR